MDEELFIIVPIVIVVGLVALLVMLVSPKLRGKLMSRQMRSTRYMLEESKDDLEKMVATMGSIAARSKKGILDQNEDILRENATRSANISKDAIEITTSAIRKGLKGNSIYCKHCGKKIDEDSTFCKFCGKEQ